jgi:hypothetical protein
MLAFSGTWQHPNVSTALGGRLQTSDEAGASVRFTFTGRAVGWVAEWGPAMGKARVYLDGVKVATVDLGAAGAHPRWISFQRSWGTVSTHTVEIRVLGTAGRPTVTLDAVTWLR